MLWLGSARRKARDNSGLAAHIKLMSRDNRLMSMDNGPLSAANPPMQRTPRYRNRLSAKALALKHQVHRNPRPAQTIQVALKDLAHHALLRQ